MPCAAVVCWARYYIILSVFSSVLVPLWRCFFSCRSRLSDILLAVCHAARKLIGRMGVIPPRTLSIGQGDRSMVRANDTILPLLVRFLCSAGGPRPAILAIIA